ncbi:hydroxymethylglutaryl-coenzyme A reductase-domain-containing protein [Pisolithus marmoratus]|nr:hydroxymethylglutaryl-coenzyme A reductase-domain-containing protein [Pisolithus marmoratus]
MRASLLPLTRRAVFCPIETITFFSIVGTLAYFHVLSAIKHSAFFAPTFPSTLRTAHALLRDGEWVGVDEEWYRRRAADPNSCSVELQQVILSSQSASARPEDAAATYAPLDLAHFASSIDNLTHHISYDLLTPSGNNYPSLCHRASVSPYSSDWSGTRQGFVDALNERATFSEDAYGVRYHIESQPTESIAEMRSSKWIAYAAKSLVVRFWELAKKADSLDILIILAGYVLMHASFIRVLLSSRALGSNFWLSTAIVSSSVLAFLLALPLSHYLSIPLDPVSLTEAMPFLVCTVGFDKPLRLARAVFNHPHLTVPVKEGRWRGQMKPAAQIVMEAMEKSGGVILRDYALEIVILAMGARSRVGGLQEFCALAGLLLVLDCILFGTFYTAILTIMVEVRRIRMARVMSRSRSSTNIKAEGKTSSLIRQTQPQLDTGLWHRISDTVLGVKGSMLKRQHNGTIESKDENPAARLKLLLIASFLTLHVLNFTTTFSPVTIAHHNSRTSINHFTDYAFPKVDITSPVLANVLRNLAILHPTEVHTASGDVLVEIAPPVHILVVPPSPKPTRGFLKPSEILENFMTAWSVLIGDPLLSKWIIFLLACSLVLNGYLLKGIAEGAIRSIQPPSVRFRSVTSTRVEKESDNKDVAEAETTAARRRPSFTIGATPKSLPDTTESDETPDVSPPPSALKPIVAPVAVHVNKENGVPAFLLDMKLRAQPAAVRNTESKVNLPVRSLEECIEVFENGPKPVQAALATLNDEEVILLAQNGKIAPYALEKVLGDLERAVVVRRALISRATTTKTLEYSDVPFANYDYSRVLGACCENVIGYIPIPLGVAGPLNIDGEQVHIPMATAEGTLVASTSRGCKALNAGGGVTTVLTNDAMTRGPAIDFPNLKMAAEAKAWVDSQKGYSIIREAFESTSRFAKLQRLKTALAGRTLFVRFATTTGDAMGDAKTLPRDGHPCPSGNYCTDKKPAAINWIEGRGKSVVAEAVIPGKVVRSVLKTEVEALCNLNLKKNLVGSAMAGSIGGFNAHAANILTAVFLATGQDPAQNVESSNCMTLMEPTNDGEDLLMTVSMPAIEVGTIGGGTVLAPQGAVLEMLGLKGSHPTVPGQNAQPVMAGELSLLSALAAGHLVRAHLVHNRSQANTPSSSRPVTPGLSPSDVVWEQRTVGRGRQPLTPSSSTSSLPPYSVEKQ